MRERDMTLHIKQQEWTDEEMATETVSFTLSVEGREDRKISHVFGLEEVAMALLCLGDKQRSDEDRARIRAGRDYLNVTVRRALYDLVDDFLEEQGNMLLILDDIDDTPRMTADEIEDDIKRRLA